MLAQFRILYSILHIPMFEMDVCTRPMAEFLWYTFFGVFGEGGVCPATLDQFLLTSFAGFGRRKEAKSLWQYAMYATVWSI